MRGMRTLKKGRTEYSMSSQRIGRFSLPLGGEEAKRGPGIRRERERTGGVLKSKRLGVSNVEGEGRVARLERAQWVESEPGEMAGEKESGLSTRKGKA